MLILLRVRLDVLCNQVDKQYGNWLSAGCQSEKENIGKNPVRCKCLIPDLKTAALDHGWHNCQVRDVLC